MDTQPLGTRNVYRCQFLSTYHQLPYPDSQLSDIVIPDIVQLKILWTCLVVDLDFSHFQRYMYDFECYTVLFCTCCLEYDYFVWRNSCTDFDYFADCTCYLSVLVFAELNYCVVGSIDEYLISILEWMVYEIIYNRGCTMIRLDSCLQAAKARLTS
jgi:hypothetical protein